jgi:hypothetical protein
LARKKSWLGAGKDKEFCLLPNVSWIVHKIMETSSQPFGLSQKRAQYRRFTTSAVYTTFENSIKSTKMTARDLEIATRMPFVPYRVSVSRNG